MIENIIKLKDYVPFFQSVLWVFFLSIIFIFFRKSIKNLVESFIERIKSGSSFEAGPLKFGEKLASLQFAEKVQNNINTGSSGIEREEHRSRIYAKNKGIFLTHILTPSKKAGCKYDTYIYLIKHKSDDFPDESDDFSDIEYAEFFFGRMWNNKVFKIENRNGLIGIIASAYDPFLCTCLIKFRDGTEIELYRYIDFEAEMKPHSNGKK